MQTMLWNFDQPLSPEDVMCAAPREGRFTRLMLARNMRRAKSPTMIAQLHECCNKGWIEYELVKLPNGVDMYTYMLTDLGRFERGIMLADGVLG